MAARTDFVDRLVVRGVAPHEARWLVEEFAVGGDDDAWVAVEAAADRRLSGEPLQYIVGHWPFCSLDLDVDPRVLIPRPETEELVGHALAALARADWRTPMVVDLGCGSGAIGLSVVAGLAERGVVGSVIAVDESLDALAVAKANAKKNNVLAATFVHSSWWRDVNPLWRGRIALVASNPPYVGADEMADLQVEVHHEPLGALVSPDCDGVVGFADVAEIIDSSRHWLAKHGVLVIEHHEIHGEPARRAAEAAGYVDVRTHRDLSGRERFLEAWWRPN
jgi:release factor glutamine methyltransferase